MNKYTEWQEGATVQRVLEFIRQYGPIIALVGLGFALGWL